MGPKTRLTKMKLSANGLTSLKNGLTNPDCIRNEKTEKVIDSTFCPDAIV